MSRRAGLPYSFRAAALSALVGAALLLAAPAGAWQVRAVGALTDGPSAPTSLAVAEDGIAALEPYAGRVALYAPGGVLAASAPVDDRARGLGRLGPSDYLYCDPSAGRVMRVDLAGGDRTVWLDGAAEPVDLVIDGTGVHVLDAASARIIVCGGDGNAVRTISVAVPAGGAPAWLSDLARDPLRNVYYALDQTNSRVLAFDGAGRFLRAQGSFGAAAGQISRGGEITCDADGWLYVADRYQGLVVVFDADGSYVASLDPLALGQPRLELPTGLAVDAAGFLYVASTEEDAVRIFHVDKDAAAADGFLATPLLPSAGDSLAVRDLEFVVSVRAPVAATETLAADFRLVAMADTTAAVAFAERVAVSDLTVAGDIVVATARWAPQAALEIGAEYGWQARSRSAATAGPWIPLQTFRAVPGPARFRLEQNYPNPFNPRTTIALELKGGPEAELVIYDIRGRAVWSRDLSGLGAGTHRVVWDGVDAAGARVSTGIYFYRLREGQSVATRKMVLMK